MWMRQGEKSPPSTWESGLLCVIHQGTESSYLTDAICVMDSVDLYAYYNNFKEDNGTESGSNTITMLWQFLTDRNNESW